MDRVKAFNREISILKKLDHVGIVKFYDAIDYSNKVYLILEYINGSTLL